MFEHFNISPHTRCIVLYLDLGMEAWEISDTIAVPKRKVRKWIEKIKKGIDIQKVSPGRGRKPVLDSEEIQEIVRESLDAPHDASTRRLSAKFERPKSVIQRTLKREGLKYGNFDQKIDLDSDQRQERVDHCHFMREEKGKKLRNTFFSDESGIHLSRSLKTKGWQDPRKKIKLSKPKKDVKLNCWGAISLKGATSLHIFEENLDQKKYQAILEEYYSAELKQLYPKSFYFVHDNHKAHKAVQKNFEKRFSFINFPTYSPDLNPIENLWAALKDSTARDAPATREELIESLQRNWDILTTPKNLKPYFESLEKRYWECIEADGQRLAY